VRPRLTPSQQSLRLLRWLGPWSDSKRSPGAVNLQRRTLEPRGVACKIYRPENREPSGIYVVAPGLHYAGPDDPRLDRFCRILAHAGFVVVAPFLRSYCQLTVAADAAEDLDLALSEGLRLTAKHKLAPPTLFSISFGCIPSLITAARSQRKNLSALFIFGGFADFNRVIRFAVHGRYWRPDGRLIDVAHDPLNRPAVFINMLPYLVPEPAKTGLREAWLTMAKRSWGRQEMRNTALRQSVARDIAASLSPRWRQMFMLGCGFAPGAAAAIEGCLSKGREDFAFTHPANYLASIRCPVFISHGQNDDVIPYPESEQLFSLFDGLAAPTQLMVTGLFSHTESALPSRDALRREMNTLKRLLRALVYAPQPPG
jgi:pimeloyl-ACP methyl ester carboxylesterase